jgi:hypothetical protein
VPERCILEEKQCLKIYRNTGGNVMDNFAFIDYLEARIEEDEAFLCTHQDELDIEDAKQKEIYEVTQGKIDMGRQILRYLEEIRKNTELAHVAG